MVRLIWRSPLATHGSDESTVRLQARYKSFKAEKKAENQTHV